MKNIPILLILIFCSYFSFCQTENKIYPVDESKNDTSLLLFIDNLKQILIEKDTLNLYNLFDERIVTSFGGAMYGKEDFIQNWELKNPENSIVWDKMLQVIELGGVFTIGGVFAETKKDTVFQFPYANSDKLYKQLIKQNPQIDFDPHTIIICLNTNVPIYKSPKKDSKTTGQLEFDILSIDYNKTYNNMISKSQETFEWIRANAYFSFVMIFGLLCTKKSCQKRFIGIF